MSNLENDILCDVKAAENLINTPLGVNSKDFINAMNSCSNDQISTALKTLEACAIGTDREQKVDLMKQELSMREDEYESNVLALEANYGSLGIQLDNESEDTAD